MAYNSFNHCRVSLESFFVAVAGADAHGLQHVKHENLAVADAAGGSGRLDSLDNAVRHAVGYGDFNFHFRHEVHGILGTAIDLGVALLAAKALGLSDRYPLDADGGERFA